MTGSGKDSCQINKKKGGQAPSEMSSSPSSNIQMMHAQIEKMEQQNRQLMEEMEAIKKKGC